MFSQKQLFLNLIVKEFILETATLKWQVKSEKGQLGEGEQKNIDGLLSYCLHFIVNVYLKEIPCINKVTLPYLTLPYT